MTQKQSHFFAGTLCTYLAGLSNNREADWIRFAFGLDGNQITSASLSRARLILASTGMNTDGFHCALAVEFAHNASLIVDDVIDRSQKRRGRESFWKHFGTSDALLASHVFVQNAFAAIEAASLEEAKRNNLQAELRATLKSMAFNEVEATRVPIAGLDAYLERASNRSGALYRYVGSMMSLASAFDGISSQLVKVLGEIGMAHQIWDDLGDADPSRAYGDMFVDRAAELTNVQDSIYKLLEIDFSVLDLKNLHQSISQKALVEFRKLINVHPECDTLYKIAEEVCGQPRSISVPGRKAG